MQKTASRTADLLHGPVFPNMMRFFVPIMLGSLLQQLYSMVDAVILGRLVGKTALAAVGGSDLAIINLVVGFFVGLASGAAVVISQHYGAGEKTLVSRAVHTAVLFSVLIGAVMTVLGITMARPTLILLDPPEGTLEDSVVYLQWYFAGMIPSMIYNMGAGILRAVGDSRRPLYFLIVCAAANTVLDLLFVAVFGMGTAGAAIATSLSQLICAVLVLYTLARASGACRLHLSKLRMDRTLLARMVAIGLPAGLASVMYCAANVIIQRAINLLGTNAAAAWSIYWKLDGIYWPISSAIGITVMTFVGQNYGARSRARIQESIRTGWLLHLGMAVFFSAVAVLSSPLTMRLFSSDPAGLAEARQFILHISSCYVLFSSVEVLSSAMRGVGNAVKPAVITFFAVCVLRMALLFTVTFPHLSVLTISICYPITWAASSVLFILYYKFGRWMPRYPESAKSE